jgi:hypothetical protein
MIVMVVDVALTLALRNKNRKLSHLVIESIEPGSLA